MSSGNSLTYEVFINEPPKEDNGDLPNEEARALPASREHSDLRRR